jgi:hypothetical protein
MFRLTDEFERGARLTLGDDGIASFVGFCLPKRGCGRAPFHRIYEVILPTPE